MTTAVLLVEDHASFRQAIAAVLGAQPDLAVAAELGSGAVADAVAAAGAADVALVDLELPDGDGVAVVAALAALRPPVPSVVLTGLVDDTALGRAVEAGARGVLRKTAEISEILQALRTVASGGTALPPAATQRQLQAAAADRRRRRRGEELRDSLTGRELEVLEHLVYGCGTDEIGQRLGISPETAQTHIRNLMGKLGAGSRLEAVSTALQHQLVDPP